MAVRISASKIINHINHISRLIKENPHLKGRRRDFSVAESWPLWVEGRAGLLEPCNCTERRVPTKVPFST